jgi:hypothetical protein
MRYMMGSSGENSGKAKKHFYKNREKLRKISHP